jgi:hypothetical protein
LNEVTTTFFFVGVGDVVEGEGAGGGVLLDVGTGEDVDGAAIVDARHRARRRNWARERIPPPRLKPAV